MLLQNTVEYLTVGDNQINVRTGYVWPVEVDGELYVVIVPTLYSDGELNGDLLTITLFDGVQGDLDLRKFAVSNTLTLLVCVGCLFFECNSARNSARTICSIPRVACLACT